MSAELKPKIPPGTFFVHCPKCGTPTIIDATFLLRSPCMKVDIQCGVCEKHISRFMGAKNVVVIQNRIGSDGSDLPNLCQQDWQKH